MKTRRYYKELKKAEKLPQVEEKEISNTKNKYGQTSSVYTVKETTIEKRVRRGNNIEDSSSQS